MTRAAPVYSADSVTKTFGERRVLKSASVWGWVGAVTVMLGRNGSGKSTLMRIGAGVLRADQGSIRFAGRVHSAPTLAALARDGLYFHPERGGLPFRGTLRDHLAAIQKRFGTRDYRHAAGMVGMEHLLDAPMIELSGGEFHRAEVAACVTREPACLIADEPYAGVSPIDSEHLTTALGHLRNSGCAIIISGHDVPSLLNIADEIVWVTSGTTHALGSPGDATRHHQFVTEYLGPASSYSAHPQRTVF